MATSSCDLELEGLVSELAVSLAPPQRRAFEAAARDVLAGLVCSGPGAAYRALRDVPRSYLDPPTDMGAAPEGPRHYRPSKLADGPALAEDSARGRAHARSRWMRGWRG